MLWFKAFHIFGVVAWFAGLFYLPRLFVYHVAADAPGRERFIVMERRLFAMMTLGALITAAFAAAMLIEAPGYLSMRWLQIKLCLVALLFGYHVWCYRLMRAFREDRNVRSERWYRIFNEAPALLLLAIVLLAVLKPL